ncbi:MAG: hypothetical protein ACE5NM_06635 [Sedimentisphaerales bacterium]
MMNYERKKVKQLFEELRLQKKWTFPKTRERLEAPKQHGVYIIYRGKKVMHVGRTLRGKKGLYQRLKNHLYGNSSFTKKKFNGSGWKLRKGFKYQCLKVRSDRKRALLEAYAIGVLCPVHIGLGK